jgi:hypothetical protein
MTAGFDESKPAIRSLSGRIILRCRKPSAIGKIEQKNLRGTLEVDSGFSNWIFAASGGAGRQFWVRQTEPGAGRVSSAPSYPSCS